MNTNVKNTLALSGLLIALGMAGCGGSSDAGSTGTLSISMTDAPVPVEQVSEVWVEFTGVTVKPQNGEQMEFVFDEPQRMDLLTLTGGTTEPLLPSTGVPAGPYNWIRLAVNASFDGMLDSYAVVNGDMVELQIPSGMQTGLKLVSGFTVTQNQATNMVIDWDLRKALVQPMGMQGQGLFLRPAMRVTDMAVYGTLSGTVDALLVNDSTCTNDLALDTGNAVYLYEGVGEGEGEGVTTDDIGSVNEPFATATVRQDDAGNYVYAFHYLSEGDYTAAFTCQASDDTADDDTGEAEIEFGAAGVATIRDDVETVLDFAPPAA